MMRCFSLVLLAGSVCIVAGCSRGGGNTPPVAKVKGMVNLDGKPMQGGEARFNAAGMPPRVLEIKEGAFSGEAYVGKNRVEIVWDKDGPPNPMDPNSRIKVNAVADRFSGVNSPFNIDISKEGSSDLKFDVTSARR